MHRVLFDLRSILSRKVDNSGSKMGWFPSQQFEDGFADDLPSTELRRLSRSNSGVVHERFNVNKKMSWLAAWDKIKII